MLAGSPNFSLAEVERASLSVPLDQVQREPIAANVARTLTVLEAVRATLGHRPVILTSLVRSASHNAEVGGSATSAHLNGYGADIVVPGMTPREVFNRLRPAVNALKLDQLILEDDANGVPDHVHISSDPKGRGQVLDLTKGAAAHAVAADATGVASPGAGAGGCAPVILALLSTLGALAVFTLTR